MDVLKLSFLVEPQERNKTLRGLVLFFFVGTLLTACATTRNSPPAPQEMPQTMVVQEDMAFSSEMVSEEYQSALAPDVERLVIQNANLALVVDDPDAAKAAIAQMAEEMGGYVVNARIYQDTAESGVTIVRAEILVRIPAEQLEDALGDIRGLSDQPPLSESLDSQDVTRDYIDLQSRLRNEEAAEAQLTNIMKQATATEDVLRVYEQLIQVRQRIEVLKGQIQYYEQSAALSAVQVSLMPDEAVQPLTIGSWQPAGVAKSAVQALLNAARFIANAAIWIVILVLPILALIFLIFVLPVWLVVHAIRRNRTRRLATISSEPPEKPQSPPEG